MCVLCKNMGHNMLAQLVCTHGNTSTAMKMNVLFLHLCSCWIMKQRQM